MRIVDRTTFLALPDGTIFAKFSPQPKDPGSYNLCADEVAIKGETVGDDDFVVQDLFPWFEGCDDSGEWADTLIRMISGEASPPLDYDFAGRDGLYDREQLFAVWDADDVDRLIARLRQARRDGYTG